MEVRFKKLHKDAVLPSYAKQGDAGMDLTSVSDYKLVKSNNEKGYWALEYETGLAVEIPEGFVGLLFPRSSISRKDLSLANSVGVVDSGYRGEVTLRFKVVGDYHNSESLYKKGDRIAQLIIVPYPTINPVFADSLSDSERGKGGYGSTGK